MVHVDAAVLALLLHRVLPEKMRLQAGAVVVHAIEGVDDRADDQHDGEHRECCQTLADGHILCGVLVNAEELEDEVCQSSKVENDDA